VISSMPCYQSGKPTQRVCRSSAPPPSLFNLNLAALLSMLPLPASTASIVICAPQVTWAHLRKSENEVEGGIRRTLTM
jgi:hypothetical protein